MLFLLDNYPRLDLEIFILCVNAVGLLVVLRVLRVSNTHERLIADPVAVDNEGVAGVERVNLKRNFVFLGGIIG